MKKYIALLAIVIILLVLKLSAFAEEKNSLNGKYIIILDVQEIATKKMMDDGDAKNLIKAIIYLSPRQEFFWVTMVFGQKATDQILGSDISQQIKEELISSKVYMEGPVIRLDVLDGTNVNDIKKLVEIKIAN